MAMPRGSGRPTSRRNSPSEENDAPLSLDAIKSLSSINKDLKEVIKQEDFLKNLRKKKLDEDVEEFERKRKERKETLKFSKTINKIAKKTGYSQDKILKDIKEQGEKSIFYRQFFDSTKTSIDELKKQGLSLEGFIAEKDNKLKGFLDNQLQKMDEFASRNETLVRNTVLGPISLLTAPFEEFFDTTFYKAFKGIGEFFGKIIKKKNPNEQDLVRKGEIGFLYLAHKLDKIFGKKEENVEKGSFLDILKGGIGGIGNLIGKVFPFASIIAGLGFMIADGFKALTAGWGTSKVSSFIGGMLGGTSKGMEGAFKNMGKWALIGAGIGTLAIPIPIVGTLIGGLLGAVVGGILGYIGGENLSKGLDKIGAWVKTNIWDKFLKPYGDFIFSVASRGFKFIGDSTSDLSKVFKGEMSIGKFVINFVSNIFGTIGGLVVDYLHKNPIGKFIDNILVKPIVKFFTGIGDFFGYIGSRGVLGLVEDIGTGKFGSNLKAYSEQKNMERLLKDEAYLNFVKNSGVSTYDTLWTSLTKEQKLAFFDRLMSLTDSQQKDIADKYMKGNSEKRKEIFTSLDLTTVKDAIIRPDGKIINTDPKDTIIATKNAPIYEPSYSIKDSLISLPKNKDKLTSTFIEKEEGSSMVFSTSSIENKLDTMIGLLQSIFNKDTKINMPPQTSRNLDLIISGGIL